VKGREGENKQREGREGKGAWMEEEGSAGMGNGREGM